MRGQHLLHAISSSVGWNALLSQRQHCLVVAPHQQVRLLPAVTVCPSWHDSYTFSVSLIELFLTIDCQLNYRLLTIVSQLSSGSRLLVSFNNNFE